MIKNTPTICSFCSNGCGMFIRTQGEESLGVIPIINHPVSEGRLCHRGWNRYQNLRSLNRILHPRVEGDSVSWEEALTKIAEKISALLNDFGPQSIGVIGSPWLTNEDNFLISLFAKTIIKTENLDGSYRFGGAVALEALERVFSSPLGSLGTIPALSNSPAILVIESVSLRDFAPIGSRVIQGYINGATLILADPSVRQAEHFYNLKLPYPLEVLPFIFQEGKEISWEVREKLHLPGLSLVFIADEVKPALSLISLISLLWEHLPAFGRILNVLPLSRSPNLRGAWDMRIKPGEGGLSLSEMLASDSKIKGLLVFGDDLINHLPSSRMREQLKNLEFLLVVDRFNTKTSQLAHIVLPLPLLAESEGSMTNCEGRIQLLRPALSPRGKTRPLIEVLGELATKMGS
ncbi:MAG: molybdopterin-dependent oxidoreductase, partial [Desulfobacterota bacterium]|nr:molybdopterin-dependent oxidoreductase [Thermodesulfobacteriota bacterium]